MRLGLRLAVTCLAVTACAAACTSAPGDGAVGHDPPRPHRSHETPSPSGRTKPLTHHRATTRRSSPAEQALARMDLAQRVGQLLMVDCPSTEVAQATVTAIRRYHVGAVILDGTTTEGVDGVKQVTSRLHQLAPPNVGLLVSTDQEGGEVQRLQGSGFSSIPTAVEQGRSAPATLQQDARTWGAQLQSAGVDVDLAPVLDTVPPHFGSNPPIGDLDREYGHRPVVVTRHGLAYLDGIRAAGVQPVAKHFPGLGRVRANTDTSSGVTDDVTTRHDHYLDPYRAAVNDDVPVVMVSSAIYSRIDPGVPGPFSRTLITGMLRGDLGFSGVVISDDLGAAQQVASVPVGQRAVRFVAAGGDMVLTVVASDAAPMTHALIQRARGSDAFRQLVSAAALRVLQLKQRAGLLR